MFSMPAPCRCTLSRNDVVEKVLGSAEFCRMSRTFEACSFGFASSNNATAPATCGDAIEVPLSTAYVPSARGKVERMLPPGAPISGLRLRSAASPQDENEEMRPPSALGTEENRAVHVI